MVHGNPNFGSLHARRKKISNKLMPFNQESLRQSKRSLLMQKYPSQDNLLQQNCREINVDGNYLLIPLFLIITCDFMLAFKSLLLFLLSSSNYQFKMYEDDKNQRHMV